MEDRRLTLREIFEEVGISINTHPKAKQSIESTTWRFYVAFVMLCEKRVHARTDSFTITMLPLVLPMKCYQRFFGQKQYGTCDSLLTLLIWHHATSGYSPSYKTTQGTRFQSRKDQGCGSGSRSWKRYFFCGSGSAKNPPLPHRKEEWRKKRNWFCYPS